MATQPDLFSYVNPDPLVGLLVQLPSGGHEHGTVVELRPGTKIHAYALRCPVCDVHRGWLPKAAVPFLQKILASFGRPTTPIVLRDSRGP